MARSTSLGALKEDLREFVAERDWGQFHTPKNLAMALSVEAAELMEHFQWLTTGESEALAPDRLAAVREELADVMIYLVMLADRLGVDPLAAAAEKLKINREKYPAEKARGKAAKYNEL
jgi:NTP pyrophosphatase (non-canonical NTP hydrolase)